MMEAMDDGGKNQETRATTLSDAICNITFLPVTHPFLFLKLPKFIDYSYLLHTYSLFGIKIYSGA